MWLTISLPGSIVPSPAPAAMTLLSVSKGVLVLAISDKWNHTVRAFVCAPGRLHLALCFQGSSVSKHASAPRFFFVAE